jgi:hypothetical protein
MWRVIAEGLFRCVPRVDLHPMESQDHRSFFLTTYIQLYGKCNICRGRQSVIAITLSYDFALSHNAFLLSRTVIAFHSCRSVHVGPAIASYRYRFVVIDKRYSIYFLSLLGKIAFKSKTINPFSSHERNIQKRKNFANVWKRKYLFQL